MNRSLFVMSVASGAALAAGSMAVVAQPPGRPGRGRPVGAPMQAFAADRDGALSPAEIDAAPAKLPKRVANKNGFIDRDELTRLARRRGGRGRSPGEGEGRGQDRGE